MIEGSVAGSVSLTNLSRSVRPKNVGMDLRIMIRILIWIRNTDFKSNWTLKMKNFDC